MAETESSRFRMTPWRRDVASQALGTTLGALVAAPLLYLGALLFGIVGDLDRFQIVGLLAAVGASVVAVFGLVKGTQADKQVMEEWDFWQRVMAERDFLRANRMEEGDFWQRVMAERDEARRDRAERDRK